MTPNIPRLQLIIDRIKANPACWNQCTWHCGTSHCLAGHAQIDSGAAPNNDTVRRDARRWLGLSIRQADWLFHPDATVADFEAFAAAPHDGRDRAGFDRDGRDRDGFNRAGFNRYGFNRDGFDRYGRDRYGFNRDGFDLDGRDREGFDRDGRDRDGVHKSE